MTHLSRLLSILVASTVGLSLAACSSNPKAGPGVMQAISTPAEDIETVAELLDAGNTKDARELLDRALRDDPMNPSLLVLHQGMIGDAKADLGPASYAYTVAEGDTMASLAQQFLGNRLKSYQLARYNAIDNPAALAPGQVIQIPGQPVHAESDRRGAATPTNRTARTPDANPAQPPRTAPPASATRAPAVDTAGAQRARTAGLAALNKGHVANAVAQLQRAAALDPGNDAIARDLARARRIASTVRSQR